MGSSRSKPHRSVRTPSPAREEPNEQSAQAVWQTAAKAAAYQTARSPARYRRYHREESILERWLEDLPSGAKVLDVPCGGGRLVAFLTARGFHYEGGDCSEAMIALAEKCVPTNRPARFHHCRLQQRPFPDNSFDCVIVWRLLHHVPDPGLRQRMLVEAARVCKRRVIVSFQHRWSFTFLRRFISHLLTGRPNYRPAMTHWRLAREAAECGLSLVETRSFCKYVSSNWFACLDKNALADQEQRGRFNLPEGGGSVKGG